MYARCVRNIADHFARRAGDYHHVRGTRHEHAARRGFDGDIVGAAFALDVELFNLEGLRTGHAGRGKADGGESGNRDEDVSGHAGPREWLRSA